MQVGSRADAVVVMFDDGSVHEVSWHETDAIRVLRDYLAKKPA